VKVLLDHPHPFLLAHGGVQVQIEQTLSALTSIGVAVETLRWWDTQQRADLIHFFGLPSQHYLHYARQKGIKVIVSALLGGLGARPAWKRSLQKLAIRATLRLLPPLVTARTGWNIWQMAHGYIALTPWEAKLMADVFAVAPDRIQVIPNGVDDFFFEQPPQTRNEWLVTTASILPVKRVVETAAAAVAAGTPYWIIGQPFSPSDPYYLAFADLCRRHPKLLRYEAARTRRELAGIYRQARGFVLLSRWESLSLSALEAAACECPVLLSDQPWARGTFGDTASFCPLTRSTSIMAKALRDFHDRAPSLPVPTKPKTWTEAAQSLKNVYEKALAADAGA
jgi:glycosyltransferase involved in cell wall biosynthesis